MSWLQRLGMAITAPRRAMAIAGERQHAGRSGSDLLAMFGVLLVATQLVWLVQATWLGAAVDAGIGFRALVQVLAGAFVLDLVVLVALAAVIAVAGGLWRDLGRAFDLACVAVLPVIFIDLAVSAVTSVLYQPVPEVLYYVLIGARVVWALGLVLAAAQVTRRAPEAQGAAPMPAMPAPYARMAGWIVIVVALCGGGSQLAWVIRHNDFVRPPSEGAPAPALALPRIGPGGALGAKVSPTPGKITVIDFWATWCGPCLRSLPSLDRFARAHPDVQVIAVDLDDRVAARELFDQQHYAIDLVMDDDDTSRRYGVTTIPHTAVIGPDGTLADTGGEGFNLEAVVSRLRQ